MGAGTKLGTAVVLAGLVLPAGAAAETVRVGVVGPFSGPYAVYGKNFRLGIEAYLSKHGTKAGGHEVSFVYRDLDAPNPARAKAIAQELIVKENVQYLAGFYFTPNAMAAVPLLKEARVPLVVFNAATSAITASSPYVVRTSFTMWQNAVPAGRSAGRLGIASAVTAVSDYAPGIDAETAFRTTFEAAGGSVRESIRIPLGTSNFASVMQRIVDSGVDGVFAFLPSGPATFGFVRAFHESGPRQKGITLLTTGDVVPEPDLPALGDAAVGVYSTYHYAVSHASPENAAFLESIAAVGGQRGEVTMTAVAAYDGTHLLHRMIEATGGTRDPDRAVAAVKGLAWTSPRGPVSLDPVSRHIRQTVHLRVVERSGDGYAHREIDSFPDQPDHGFDVTQPAPAR